MSTISIVLSSLIPAFHPPPFLVSLSFPALFLTFFCCFSVASSVFSQLKLRWRARQLGSEVVPEVGGGLPLWLCLFFNKELREISTFAGQPGEAARKLHQRYGPIVRIRDRFFTIEPSHTQQVLATNFDNFGKSPNFLELFKDILGLGVFMSDQKTLWKFHRNLTRPHFAKEVTNDFSHFHPHVTKLIDYLSSISSKAEPIDVQELFGRMTMDIGTELFFGSCIGSLDELINGNSAQPAGRVAAKDFIAAFTQSLDYGLKRRQRPFWYIREKIFGNSNDENMKLIGKVWDDIIQKKISGNRMLKLDGREKSQQEVDGTLLDHLIAQTDDLGLIKEELLNILLAARDTTASLLSSVILLLARHPKIFEKARHEVVERNFASNVDYDELKECRYLKAIIDEALRIAPPVPSNGRYSFGEDVFTVGERRFYVPPKTTVLYNIFLIQTRKDLWGEDAEEFDPDRWLDERVKRMTSNSFQYQPFSAGPRICLGQKFAKNEVTYTICRILQTFSSVSIAYDVQDPKSVLSNGDIFRNQGLTFSYKGGVNVRFTPATKLDHDTIDGLGVSQSR